MTRKHWNAALTAMVLVRLGQELGSDSQLARGIAGMIDALLRLASLSSG